MESIIVNRLKQKLVESKARPKIVLPEGWNASVIEASQFLKVGGIIEPLVLFRTKKEIPHDFKNVSYLVIDEMDLTKYADKLYDLRKAKGMTIDDAKKIVQQPNYLASLMVKMDEVDGEVCGIEYTTKDTLKPALQIIKTSHCAKLVSSAFILEKGNEVLIFADCALNLNPTAIQLVNITKNTLAFQKLVLGCKNTNTALLTYSTAGSGIGESPDKVREAHQLLQNEKISKTTKIFGDMQFDAAYVNAVRAKKAPKVKWDDHATTFIFPNLDAGNIGYKIAQRLGGYSAIGPVLLGLDKPVNDLSRGATTEDIIATAYITAAQTLADMCLIV